MEERILFTSESVSEGHPDKLCDQISDAIVDECLKQDPSSRVACECFTTTDFVLIGGEINSQVYNQLERKAQEIRDDFAKLSLWQKLIPAVKKLDKKDEEQE